MRPNYFGGIYGTPFTFQIIRDTEAGKEILAQMTGGEACRAHTRMMSVLREHRPAMLQTILEEVQNGGSNAN